MNTSQNSTTTPTPPAPAPISFKAFLESTPVLISSLVKVNAKAGQHSVELPTVPIELYCGSVMCGGVRFHDPTAKELYISRSGSGAGDMEFLIYACRNCRSFGKEFALDIRFTSVGMLQNATIYKIGENPAFGEPRPDVITDVLDDEIAYFDRGYRSETAGLGIGAFAYYRRFVDSHKDKLIAKIREVALAQGVDGGVLDALDRAARTNSFERAVDEIKEAIPPVLRLKGGHNPLTVLYDALSIGIHADDDVECLQRAQDIRTVLAALAERMELALAASGELDSAVARLVSKKTKPSA